MTKEKAKTYFSTFFFFFKFLAAHSNWRGVSILKQAHASSVNLITVNAPVDCGFWNPRKPYLDKKAELRSERLVGISILYIV